MNPAKKELKDLLTLTQLFLKQEKSPSSKQIADPSTWAFFEHNHPLEKNPTIHCWNEETPSHILPKPQSSKKRQIEPDKKTQLPQTIISSQVPVEPQIKNEIQTSDQDLFVRLEPLTELQTSSSPIVSEFHHIFKSSSHSSLSMKSLQGKSSLNK